MYAGATDASDTVKAAAVMGGGRGTHSCHEGWEPTPGVMGGLGTVIDTGELVCDGLIGWLAGRAVAIWSVMLM